MGFNSGFKGLIRDKRKIGEKNQEKSRWERVILANSTVQISVLLHTYSWEQY